MTLRFNAVEVTRFIDNAVLRGASHVTDWDNHSVIWTMFNPLTDSNVVLEIDFESVPESDLYDVESQMRDHDGEGENIPHTITQSYHSDDECSREYLSIADALYSIGMYITEQEAELALRVRINTENIGGTALAAAFKKFLNS